MGNDDNDAAHFSTNRRRQLEERTEPKAKEADMRSRRVLRAPTSSSSFQLTLCDFLYNDRKLLGNFGSTRSARRPRLSARTIPVGFLRPNDSAFAPGLTRNASSPAPRYCLLSRSASKPWQQHAGAGCGCRVARQRKASTPTAANTASAGGAAAPVQGGARAEPDAGQSTPRRRADISAPKAEDGALPSGDMRPNARDTSLHAQAVCGYSS